MSSLRSYFEANNIRLRRENVKIVRGKLRAAEAENREKSTELGF